LAASLVLPHNSAMVGLRLVILITLVVAAACARYDPLKDACVRQPIGVPVDEDAAVKVTFLRNTSS
jgi:hypothetical protein